MSEEMKMSDVFELPMMVDGHSAESQPSIPTGSVTEVVSDIECDSGRDAKYVAHAINNHDRLTEENAALKKAVTWHVSNTMKLYKENRKLREVLNDLTGIAIHCHAVGVKLQPYQLAEISDARKLLEELK